MISIRWLIRRDIPEVTQHAAEQLTGWDETAFIAALRQNDMIGMVVDDTSDEGKIKGCCIYRLLKESFELLYLTVGVRWEGKGFGRAMVERLQKKCLKTENGDPGRRQGIFCDVPEELTEYQRFLQAMGFTARSPTGRDRQMGVYRMTWEKCPGVPVPEAEEAVLVFEVE